MLPFILICISAAACASGAEPPPLPIWDVAYAKDLQKIPDHKTTFLSADYSELVMVLADGTGKKVIKTASLNKRVVPHVHVDITLPNVGQYQYLYTIANDTTALDAILRFSIVIPATFDNPFATTNGEIGGKEWNGGVSFPVIAKQCEIESSALGR